MKWFIPFLTVFSVFSLESKPCVKCKHFRGTFLMEKYGTCSLFPKVNEVDYSLVAGVKKSKRNLYEYCSIIREYNPDCGIEGKLFKKR
jgi:hypothetical protein